MGIGSTRRSARSAPTSRPSSSWGRCLRARSRRSPATTATRLYAATGGNPFYVTELLASRTASELPPSVANAVLGRLARLDDASRRLVDLVSVVPTRMNASLLDAVMPDWAAAAVEPERRQLLDVDAVHVRFRHELARNAIRSSIPIAERRRLHGEIVAALLAADADPADIVHHAEAAGAEDVVADHALVAARRAAALESNREAYSHYRRALDFLDRMSAAEQAQALEEAGHGRLRRRPARRRLRSDRARDRAVRLARRAGGGRPLHARRCRGSTGSPATATRRRTKAREAIFDPRAARRVGRAGPRLQRPVPARDARGEPGAGLQVGRAGARARRPPRRRADAGARADQHRERRGSSSTARRSRRCSRRTRSPTLPATATRPRARSSTSPTP